MMKAFFLLAALLASSMTYAGHCGEGKVIRVMEGGWNSDDLMIVIDYSKAASSHPGTEVSGFIVYKKSSVPNRIDGIRAIALSALMADKNVQPYTHTGNCGDATELSVFR